MTDLPYTMTAEELCEIIDTYYPHDPERQAMTRAFIDAYPSALGYDVALAGCAVCGEEHFAIFPVPTQFPVECPYCHNVSAYIEARND